MIKYHGIKCILTNGTITDKDTVIDHENGDKLDNRIENLKLTTQRENQQNRHKHRNGRLTRCRLHMCGKWEAYIQINGKKISLGLFNTEAEAHETYNEALTMLDKSIEEIQKHFNANPHLI